MADEIHTTKAVPFTPSWERKAYCGMCSTEWPQRYPSCPGCDCGKLNRLEAADGKA